jgi:hypothetical protein
MSANLAYGEDTIVLEDINVKNSQGQNILTEIEKEARIAKNNSRFDYNKRFPDSYNFKKTHFLNGYRITAYIGKPGSGKTSLLVSYLTGKKDRKVFRNVFDHILLIMPESFRDSMKKNIFKKHDEDEMFDELDYGTLSTIHERLLKSSSENENTLLILDDVGASLKNNEIRKY